MNSSAFRQEAIMPLTLLAEKHGDGQRERGDATAHGETKNSEKRRTMESRDGQGQKRRRRLEMENEVPRAAL